MPASCRERRVATKLVALATETDGRIFDDTSGVATSIDDFVIQDSDPDERCALRICARDW